MDACFSGPAIALIGVIISAMAAAIGAQFWQIIAAKNAHIKYVENVNADLTEMVTPAIGTARSAVEEVKTVRRRQTGRQG